MSTCRSPSLSLELGTPITPGFEALVFKASRGIEDIYELTAHMPVIALSANAMPRDIEKGMRAGFFRYLTKPIKVNEFTATLEVAMNFAGQGMFQDT
jgi:CheY-like chemotaxis protein